MAATIVSRFLYGRESASGEEMARQTAVRALSSSLVLAAALAAAPAWAAQLTRGPYLQLLTAESVTVVWNTDTAAGCSLRMRPLGGAERVIVGEMGTVCAITVDGLAAGTAYAYVPEADGVALWGASVFRSDDPDLQSYTFLVLGDSGTGGPEQMAVRDRMLEIPADFIFYTGDMVYEDGTASEYDQRFFAPYQDLLRRLVIWPCRGNHDVRTNNGGPWREAFYTPANNPAGTEDYYSFDFGNAHVVILDSTSDISRGSPQYMFVEQDLRESTAIWNFVAFHHTIYSSGGGHGSDTVLRDQLTPLFDEYGVDMVFMGHDHDYERTEPLRDNQVVEPGEGTVYVTTGGGGRSLHTVRRKWFTAYAESAFHFTRVTVAGRSLVLEMIRDDGAIRDSMTLEKGEAPRCGDDLVNQPGERCDGTDDAACPRECDLDCQCPPVCGDGVVNQPAEECDGTDDDSCAAGCGLECVCAKAPSVFDLEPAADTYVEKGGEATWDHGAAPHMDVDKRPRGISYLKFDLRGVTARVTAATLRLYCTNASDDGGTIYPVADSSWVEGDGNGVDSSAAGGPGLKWIDVDTNKDGILDELDGSPYVPDFARPVVSLGAVSRGQTLEVDVTATFQDGPGMYTLAISGEKSSNGATYSSRERLAAEKRPLLTLEVGSSGACSFDGERCADGDLCTWPDICQGGVCVAGDPLTCAAPDRCHEAGVCDPSSGRCSNPQREDGAPCDDASVCTENDVCVGGVCIGENRVICPSYDQCHRTAICDPATGECTDPLAKADGTPCDDGNACTELDMCLAGVCVGAEPVICVAPDGCHDPGACDQLTGLCSPPRQSPDQKPCDDGDRCTRSDACAAGVCVGGDPVVCVAPDACHGSGVCDPSTGLCSIPEMPDEVRLRFGAEADAHTDSAQPGVSFGASTSIRLDGRPERNVYLRFDVSGIEALPVKRAIVRLRTTDARNAGSPSGGSIHTVSDGTWKESTLTHANRPAIDGPALASVGAIGPSETVDYDVTAAIIGDGTYDFGILAGSTNMAILSSREAMVGQPELIVFAERPCDDGDACTQVDSCVNGECVGRNRVTCAALDECHDAGVCEPATGVCTYAPKADGTPCGGGSPCSGLGVCVNGACEASAPVDCDDGVGCTEDICDDATGGCVHIARDAACDNGIHCDGREYCHAELGCVVEPVDCDDRIPCTIDWCDEELRECVRVPDDESCDDGNVCTTDTCDPVVGCEHGESGLCEPVILEVEASADTYIEKGAEGSWDHGAAGHLDADTRPRGITYLKFDLGDLSAPVRTASLRLYCMNASDDGGTVYPVADSSWVEGIGNGIDSSSEGGPGLKWIDVDTNGDGAVNEADASPYVPDFGRPAASLGPVSRGQTLWVDVSAAVDGGPRTYTLAIANGSSNGVTYWSRERSDALRRPMLHLELAPPGP